MGLEEKDYSPSLNLPRTDFPMKANLVVKEVELLRFWDEIGLYDRLRERGEGELFVLHDGPPYANGRIHIGTAFNKILKDFVPKFKWMRGYRAPYVPGWDTHGLPIELQVLKEMGLRKGDLDPVELRRRCREYALRYVELQREDFKRLGVLGDWDNPYITLSPSYEAEQIRVFKRMVEKGYVYRGLKSIFWCVDCETALAAAEIEYHDKDSPSIYVFYPFPPETRSRLGIPGELEAGVLIWTTTPWTLPASMAVALHPEHRYDLIRAGGRVYLVASRLVERLSRELGWEVEGIVASFLGSELEGLEACHPFYNRRVPLVLADYVTLEDGTGCVHTAPAHGAEDYETGLRYGLLTESPVDERGYFLPEVELVGGRFYLEANGVILEELRRRGFLLGEGKVRHSYPHCWRCKKPVIFRSTRQWFVAVEKFREEALRAIEEVQWVPHWGKARISDMVRERGDWCISRQRVWGVPIPAFYCEGCGELLVEPEIIERVASLVEEHGSDIWWTWSSEEILGELCRCGKCGSTALRKETDIMDVWFDSGVSHVAVLKEESGLRWPADMYLEGTDQHRGWFQTSLLTSVALTGKAPYRTVLTHGFIVDGEGRKMSKSLGNVVVPQEVIDRSGADILRLWVASSDYSDDVRISEGILAQLVEAYRRIRNTARFMLSNLYDFDPRRDALPREELLEVDRWVLSRLQHLISRVTQAYEEFVFHLPYHLLHAFCVNDLSAFYHDINKDRLYTSPPFSRRRRSCQTANYVVLEAMTKMLAPLLSFTCEEIWQHLRRMNPDLPESVFLSSWPEPAEELRDEALEERWDRILRARKVFLKALERARASKAIGHSLEAELAVEGVSAEAQEVLSYLDEEAWSEVCIVSGFRKGGPREGDKALAEVLEEGFRAWVFRAEGERCPRCWHYGPLGARGVCGRCELALKEMGL